MRAQWANMRRLRTSVPARIENGRCSDPTAIRSVAARFGLTPVAPRAIAQARAFAAEKLGGRLASVGSFEAVQTVSEATLFAAYDEHGAPVGVFAGFALNAEGAERCAAKRFDAANPAINLVCAPSQTPCAWYGWGFAASSKMAAWAVVSAARAIQSELFWGVPAYARAVTADGARITQKIGYRALCEKDPSFVWIPANAAPCQGRPA